MTDDQTSADTNSQHPGDYERGPLVPLTLRIGVTGHRPNKLAQSDPELLTGQVRKVLTELNKEMTHLLGAEETGWLYQNPSGKPHIRILSALAEGSDRILVDRDKLRLNFDFELIAALPFERHEYERDFGTQSGNDSVDEFARFIDMADTVVELGGHRYDGDRSYERVGEFIVRQSDVLVAIWDPDEQDPGRGGTQDVIHRAIMEGLTVICIDARSPHDLSVRRGRDQSPKTSAISLSPYSTELLEDYLRQQLLFSNLFYEPELDNNEDIKRRSSIGKRFNDFTGESGFSFDPEQVPDYTRSGPLILGRKRLFGWGNIYRVITTCIAPISSVNKQEGRWDLPSSDTAGGLNSVPIPIQGKGIAAIDRIFAAFLRADQLATHYSHLHRSIFISIYICGGLALSMASLALFADDGSSVGDQRKYLWASFEFVFLFVILLAWWKDHSKRYHDRWIEYRSIAEFLRPMIHLSLLGRAYPLNKLREQQEEVGQERLGRGGPARSWVFMYVETVLRWAGIASIKSDADGEYLRACRKFWRANWFGDQASYHSTNAARMHVLGKRLQICSWCLFWLTWLMVSLKLLSGSDFDVVKPWLENAKWPSYAGLLAGILPALGTIAFAIRNHAEFDISAQRSLSMRIRFLRWMKRLDRTKGTTDVDALTDLLDDAAESMIREASDWGEIFEVKESETA